jgi:hypothetical protein
MYEPGEHTWEVDVYSFALILYEILAGKQVFPATMEDTILSLWKRAAQDEQPMLPAGVD